MMTNDDVSKVSTTAPPPVLQSQLRSTRNHEKHSERMQLHNRRQKVFLIVRVFLAF